MTLETADKVIQFILDNYQGRTVALKWFGGEPLYNKEIIDYICKELRRRNIDYSSRMISNAYLFNDCMDEVSNLWNLKSVQVTLDALFENYNRIKSYIYDKNENAFERIVSNIELLLNAGIKVSIRINFNPEKLEDAIQTIEFIHQQFGNHKNLFVYCAPIIGDFVPPISKYSGMKNPYITLFTKLIDLGYIRSLAEMNVYPQILNCGIYNSEFLVVDTLGHLHKCQHAIIEGENDAFGSVEEGIMDDAKYCRWTSLDYPFDECIDCVCLPLCQGGCRYRALCEDKDNICFPIKNCVVEILKLFYHKVVMKSNKLER